ncbi:MAG: hypothetical protein GWN87_27860, partial [Desulfuromonadales bacterium]|nr:hypothetical protein [Desulfuromonadales bacterium]
MIVRELLTRVGFQTDRRSIRTADSAISGLKRAAGALAAVFAGGALAQGVRQMVELASDAEETRNVIRESFGQSAEAVQDWAAQQADAVGRSRFQLEEYAATLGAIITPLTGNAEASAAMSQELAQLAVDLGSFFNAAETDVLAALKSGLIGSTEPMMKFGVVMTQANLEAFRLEQGIGKSVKQMTEAEKTTLRYQFILSKTTAAQGDAARTADGYANLTKRLQANLKDLGTEIGFALLPGAIDLLNTLVALTQTVRDNLGPALDSLLRVGRALALAFNTIAESIAGMSTGFKVLAAVGVVALTVLFAPGLAIVA